MEVTFSYGIVGTRCLLRSPTTHSHSDSCLIFKFLLVASQTSPSSLAVYVGHTPMIPGTRTWSIMSSSVFGTAYIDILNQTRPYHIVFEASIGDDSTIAIADVELRHGLCSPNTTGR